VVEYVYPMKTDGKATRTLDDFAVTVRIRSQHPVQTVYSPTHAVTVNRKSDREVVVEFEKNQAILDQDFQLFYGLGNQEIGLTPILYRPVSSEDGYFTLLISPQVEATKANRVPRDLVMVLDTSGSMSDAKMAQAKKALKFCLSRLGPDDRFGIVSFATTVRTYRDELLAVSDDQLQRATKWVDDLRQSGGTAILPALNTALGLRTKDEGRSFTVVFFTDGMPTVDETNPEKIVKAIEGKNTANTRIFTFGVGDDVNAAMLDRLADATKAVSTFVRPAEDIEAKVSSLHSKISHPVMTNVKLTATNVKLHEVYPPQLPDLFHGGQLVVIGRFSGQGAAAVKLTGMVGKEQREMVYELTFPPKTDDGKEFVEHLWARRKVGYILDQIRANGEQKELVEEVTKLAKKYGIATPYTSYLVVPDGPMPVAEAGRSRRAAEGGAFGGFGGAAGRPGSDGRPTQPPALAAGGLLPGDGASGTRAAAPPGAGGANATTKPANAGDVARAVTREAKNEAERGEALGKARGGVQDKIVAEELKKLDPEARKGFYAQALQKAGKDAQVYDEAAKRWKAGDQRGNQVGSQGVDLAVNANNLRYQTQLTQTACRTANGRSCVEVGGVWIDDKFDAKMKTVLLKAQSEAYFRILDKHPKMKDVYRLGNHIVWVTPNNTALVIDQDEGQEKLSDEEIGRLFTAAK
jgi:Ca-activated chloride channel family protein